ncbi:multidrug effflux MFS transporter [Corynebacterium freneyi]|uniref:multidrug effflux MFS transporter n=1 Tax=Corynebacterium freneyi TaxID=134034 RepID=UPI00254DFAA4|nr:multidrug effflux MFS transporter [Corynebacterium freneyi]MDK8767495.1 multidrug effflux MFS transporter [Corynebacterium freneyi]
MRAEIDGKNGGVPLPLLAALALATMAGPLSIDTYLPAFPLMAGDLGTNQPGVQLTLTLFMAGMALGQFFIGPMSDSMGRRRLLLGSQLLAAVAAFVCAVAPDVWVMWGGRFVHGIAGGAGVVLARAVVADLAAGKSAARAFSLMMLINGIAPILAPIIGALLLVPFGWRSIFVFMGVFNVAALVVLAAVVKESLPPENRSAGGLRGLFGGIAEVVKIRGFLGYVIAFWFSFGAMFAYISGSPFVMQGQLGLGVGTYSLLFAVASAMIVLGSAISARIVNTVDPRRLLAAGIVAMLVASVLLLVDAHLNPTVWIIVPLLMTALGAMGFIMGNATALATGLARRRAGAASAMLGAGQFVVAGAISPLVGLGADAAVTMGTVMACSLAVALLGFIWAVKREGASE